MASLIDFVGTSCCIVRLEKLCHSKETRQEIPLKELRQLLQLSDPNQLFVFITKLYLV